MKYTTLILFLISFVANTNAQFNHLDVNDGLSQNSILSLCQDSTGFLWFGTSENGLNRYDGKKYRYYTHIDGDNNSIPSNSITKLAADNNGDVWVGTNNGLSRYVASKGKFYTAYYKDQNNILYSFSKQYISSIKKSKNGIFWLVASGKVYYKKGADSIFRVNPRLNHSFVNDVEPIGNDKLLIASYNAIQQYHINEDRLESITFLDKKIEGINCLYSDSKGIVYVGTKKMGFALYDPTKDSTHYFSVGTIYNMKSDYIRTFCEDHQGNVYVGSFNGLYRIHTPTMQFDAFYSEDNLSNALSHNSIYDILRDEAGNIWIATYSGGISVKFATQYDFVTYSRNVDKKGSLLSNVINTFYEDEYGVWIGTDGAGVAHYKDGNIKHYQYRKRDLSSISGNHIKAFLKHSKDHLWVGGHQSGLNLFNQNRGVVEGSFFSKMGIYSIARDKDGLLWLASPGNGILFFDELNMSPIEKNVIPKEKALFVKYLYYSAEKDIMWICTTSAIYFYNFETNNFFEIKDYASPLYSLDNVHHLNEDRNGNVWIATTNGLLKLSNLNITNGKCDLKYFNATNLFPSNNIMAVLEDSNGDIWASSINCIMKLDQNNGSLKIYNHDYNLQTSDFLKGSAFRSADDRLWFGGNGGFTVFDPKSIESNSFVPDLCITDLRINDQSIVPNDESGILHTELVSTIEITLDHWQNNISLSVAAFNYTLPDRNYYKWILTNNSNFKIQGESSEISIASLPADEYKLSIWASNNDNVWNPMPRELLIEILPPWYKSSYAIFAYIILAVILFIVGKNIIVERARVANQIKMSKLQRVINEKVYNQKVEFFTNISHEIKTPLSLILGPVEYVYKNSSSVETKTHLQVAIRNIQYLKKLVDELINFRKQDQYTGKVQLVNLDIQMFVRKITELFEQSLSYANTPVTFISKCSSDGYIDPVALEKIILNILYNAYKYNDDNSEIIVTLTEDYPPIDSEYQTHTIGDISNKRSKTVVISIIDHGSGISQENLPRIFDSYYQIASEMVVNNGFGLGLAFVKKLILMHRGELKVSSRLGVGSVFSIKLPIGELDYEQEDFRKDYLIREDHILSRVDLYDPITELGNNPNNSNYIKNMEHTVLIVEDNEELREWMTMLLSAQYNCIVANNGVEGVEIALKKLPNIIISDVMMPLKNGFELCKELKGNLKTSHIPIILLTAKATDVDKKEGLEFGADAYIFKPFDQDILLWKINNFIQLRKKIIENYNMNTDDSSHSFIENLSHLDKKLIESVYAYVEAHLSDYELNIDDMASSLFTSRSTLYRKIKSLSNTTPNEFIKNYRLKIAYSLIKEKKLSVLEISEMVGFQDVYYFKRCFMKKYEIKL